MSKIYSFTLDTISDDRNSGTINGSLIELFHKGEDETDKEVIDAGYARVEKSPETDGEETLWAELWEINQARKPLLEVFSYMIAE